LIYLRSFLFQLFFWLWSVVWAIGMIVTYPLPRRANTWSLSTWSKGLIWGLRWLADIKVEVRGEGTGPPALPWSRPSTSRCSTCSASSPCCPTPAS
jgi:1-acyl-sn-glycerol-3-phosphate acyltransferase